MPRAISSTCLWLLGLTSSQPVHVHTWPHTRAVTGAHACSAHALHSHAVSHRSTVAGLAGGSRGSRRPARWLRTSLSPERSLLPHPDDYEVQHLNSKDTPLFKRRKCVACVYTKAIFKSWKHLSIPLKQSDEFHAAMSRELSSRNTGAVFPMFPDICQLYDH